MLASCNNHKGSKNQEGCWLPVITIKGEGSGRVLASCNNHKGSKDQEGCCLSVTNLKGQRINKGAAFL